MFKGGIGWHALVVVTIKYDEHLRNIHHMSRFGLLRTALRHRRALWADATAKALTP